MIKKIITDITLKKPSLKYKPICNVQHPFCPHSAYLELERH